MRWRLRDGWRGEAARLGAAVLALAVSAPVALAEEPVDFQMGFQASASPVRDQIDHLHNDILLPIITVITIFVLGLLVYVMVRFRASSHPVPTKTTHNTVIELLWTTVPILVLLFIAVPSFKLLYFNDRTEKADLTLKVTGHQWYWSYEYPDQGLTEDAGLQIDSNLLVPEDQPVKPGQKRLLDVDNPILLPVGAKVRILVTGTDVIHSWFVPSLGVQTYAIQGRANETWTEIERPDTYYGQCNQICGLRHPFMPIEIKAVSKADFDQWVASKKKKAEIEQPRTDASLHLAAETTR
jgi:cytochrome c oxidase subunit II